jgi:hypothetical protein
MIVGGAVAITSIAGASHAAGHAGFRKVYAAAMAQLVTDCSTS